MSHSQLFVIAGPTAVGKGTVVHALRDVYPGLPVSVSVTTRSPRPGEVDGQDYFFVTEDEFGRLVRDDALLEWATVHGLNRYGTPEAWVDQELAEGRTVLLELDLEGARQVRAKRPDSTLIFLAPPSWGELVKRLTSRGTEGREEQSRRLETARTEMAAQSEFDAVVINDDLHTTVEELAALMGLN